jgi:hypothetical protein
MPQMSTVAAGDSGVLDERIQNNYNQKKLVKR